MGKVINWEEIGKNILEMYKSGKSLAEIGRIYNISPYPQICKFQVI